MTEQEKREIIDELENRMDQKYKRCLAREDTQSVLKNVRTKWFAGPNRFDSPMFRFFGAVTYWKVWELTRRLTCIICGYKYVRDLSGCSYAEDVAEQLCQTIYNLKLQVNKQEEESE